MDEIPSDSWESSDSWRPLEELLQDSDDADIGCERLSKEPNANTELGLSKLEAGSAERATVRLSALLGEPWAYTISRLLVRETPTGIRKLCNLYGMQEPGHPLDIGHWTVAVTRQVYEPALVRIVRNLLLARANVNGSPNDKCRTPLMHCAMEGLQSTMTVLLDARAEMNRSDVAGRTALHFAVIQQEMDIVETLVALGAEVTSLDATSHDLRSIARLHGSTLPPSDEPVSESPYKRAKGHAESKISVPSIPAYLCQCNRFANIFLSDFVGIRRPALLRGGAANLVKQENWSRTELIKSAGNSQVEIGAIPYSFDFGVHDDILVTTIARFFEVEIDLFSSCGVPYYLFTIVDEELQPELLQYICNELGHLPTTLPPPFSNFTASALQFSAGSQGSGSPVHFHDDAFNILMTGCKQWFLWPPSHAAMSRIHPARLDQNRIVDFSKCVRVQQLPGDIMYVPCGWGHAVLNLVDDTVSVAVEFAV